MNCNVLKENAVKEAKSIRDNLSLLISQLPARVQTMTVSPFFLFYYKVAEFCKTFGFELVDGNLVMMEDANAYSQSHHLTKRYNQTSQPGILKTIQTRRDINQAVTPLVVLFDLFYV